MSIFSGKKINIDLHCHSNFSDGDFSVRELAEIFHKNKIEIASLTDHNSIKGCMEFKNALSEYKIKFIYGTEINIEIYSNREIHLLIYGFDLFNKNILKVFDKINSDISRNFLLKIKERSKKFSWKDNISEIINIFHDAGGYIFLAHPLIYFNNYDELENLIFNLSESGIDGLECYFKPYSDIEIKYLSMLAHKYDMLITGGSDFHYHKKESYDYEFPSINKSIEFNSPGIEIPLHVINNTLNLLLKNID